MSNFGIQIFNDRGENIVDKYSGSYVVDTFDISGSAGSRSYSLGPGESLDVAVSYRGIPYGMGVGGVKISGNSVVWQYDRYGFHGAVVMVIKRKSL